MTAGLKLSFQKYFARIQIASLNESVWRLRLYQPQQNRAALIIKISDVCSNGAFWSFYLPENHLKTWKVVSRAFIRVENCEILQLAFTIKIHFPWNVCVCQQCKSVMLDNSIWQLFNNLPLSSLRFSSKNTLLVHFNRQAAVNFFHPQSLENIYSGCKTISSAQPILDYQESTFPMDKMSTLGTVLQSRKSYHQPLALCRREESQKSSKSINLY